MRVSEVLKLTREDIEDRKLILRDPKSGRGTEVAFVPQKVADRLKEYVHNKAIGRDRRIFPISYTAARMLTVKAGRVAGIQVRPHDLRRHAATDASRSGVPIEIVSKVILRHANLATTQRYLGKVSDTEAMQFIPANLQVVNMSRENSLASSHPTNTIQPVFRQGQDVDGGNGVGR
jgi:integrase/recombinase XerD